jgi:signal transduction histidine kinase
MPGTTLHAPSLVPARALWIRNTMPAAPRPTDENRRLHELHRYGVLDQEADGTFVALTNLAAKLAEVPVALISLTDADRQWFMVRLGVELTQVPRDFAPCAHVVYERKPIICADMREDARFADNPLVVGPPHVRFYAGFPLLTPGGSALGALTLLDTRPRTLDAFQVEALVLLAQQVVAQLELRRAYDELKVVRAQEREFEHRLHAEKIEEAQQLAAELHDGVGQELSGISMLLAAALRMPEASVAGMRMAVEEALPLITAAIDSCRRVAEGYGGFLVRNEGIMGALQRYVRRLKHLREAIANACRHSRGTVVRIRCVHADAHIGIVVEDNGVGLGEQSGIVGGGLGRSIMEYRARSIGARLSHDQAAGGGLHVRCEVPCLTADSCETARLRAQPGFGAPDRSA